MGTTSAFRPTRSVALEGAAAVVRELDWTGAMEFLGMVGTHARDIIKPMTDAGADLAAIKREIFAQAPALVTKVKELGDYLLTNALDKPEVMEGRGITETLQVLRAAVELNLSPAVLEAADALGKSLAGALASKTRTSTPPQ